MQPSVRRTAHRAVTTARFSISARAFTAGNAAVLPPEPQKSARRVENRTVLVVRCGQLVGLRQRPKRVCSPVCGARRRSMAISPDELRGGLTEMGWSVRKLLSAACQTYFHPCGVAHERRVCRTGRTCTRLTFVTPAELRDAYALPSAFRSFVSVLRTDPCNCKPSFTPFRRCTTASRACCCSARFQARNPARSGFFLRPPAEPVLARAGGCAWRGGAGLHRGQARDVPGIMWRCGDTIAKCDIAGASDTSIRNAEPNDIGKLLRESKITRIFCHRRQVGAAVPQTHRAENRRARHAAALHQSRERRMVAREADRGVPALFFDSRCIFYE